MNRLLAEMGMLPFTRDQNEIRNTLLDPGEKGPLLQSDRTLNRIAIRWKVAFVKGEGECAS